IRYIKWDITKYISKNRIYIEDNQPQIIILINDDDKISSMNNFINDEIPKEFHHAPVNRVFPNIMTTLKSNNIHSIDTSYGDKNYRVHYYEDHNSLLLLDITDEKIL